jgi:hypothetical protein
MILPGSFPGRPTARRKAASGTAACELENWRVKQALLPLGPRLVRNVLLHLNAPEGVEGPTIKARSILRRGYVVRFAHDQYRRNWLEVNTSGSSFVPV